MRQAVGTVRQAARGRSWRALVAIGAVVALAGCGGGGGESDEAPPPPAGGASAPSPAATIAGPDGATLKLPEGALAAPAPTVRIAKDASAAPPLPGVFASAGDVFAVSPDGVALQVLGTLRIPVDPTTPDDTPIAIAEANASGGWTLRADARIDGAMVEIEVARLGHFRVVKPAAGLPKPSPKPGGAPMARKYVAWTFGIGVTAPGFVPVDLPDGAGGTVKLLQKADPFPGIGTVAASAQAFGSILFCPDASAIDVEYQSLAPGFAIPAGNQRLPISPARGGPWSFDVRIFKPVDLPYAAMSAAVTVHCNALLGGSYAVRAERTIRYELDPAVGGLVLSAPGFTATGTAPAARRLRANAAFPSPTSVPVTVQLATPPGAASQCTVGRSLVVDYFAASTGNRFAPLVTQEIPILPPHAAPWTFDLRVFQVDPSITGTWARVTLHCDDAAGMPLAITAEQTIEFFAGSGTAIALFSHPVDKTVVVGQSATFEVSVSGGPSPPRDLDHYRVFWEQSRDTGTSWQTVGIGYQTDVSAGSAGEGRVHAFTLGPLTSADNGSLLRARVCYAPSGQTEQCIQSRNAQLTVVQGLVAPQVTRQPRNMATLIGETASFDVAFSGTPGPSVRWQLLSADATTWLDIGSAAAWPGTAANAATLVTPAGTLADNGSVLRAVVTNLGGEVASQPVVWRVTTTPVATAVTLEPVDARTVAGGSAVFAALAEGTAPLSYQWSHDGAPIAGATSPVLAIGNVQAADLGSYRLAVSGPGGSATSRAASLTVSSTAPPATAPSIVQQPSPKTVDTGNPATFTIAVAGDPAPACQWTKNGVAIPGATSCTSYTTPAVTGNDNGAVFNVVAYNAGGAAFAGGALLTVTGGFASDWLPLTTGTGSPLYDVTLVGGDPTKLVAVGFNATLLRSTDAGASWTRIAVPFDSGYWLQQVKFRDALVGIAVGTRHILRTADGGATWQAVWRADDVEPALGLNRQSLTSFDWLDANTLVAVGVGGSRVWRSTDAGLTWSLHGTVEDLNVDHVDFDDVDARVGIATTHYRAMRTSDGGLTWSEVGAGFQDAQLRVANLGRGQWLIAGGHGIYRSSDGGVTWTRSGGWPYLLGVRVHGNRVRVVGDDGFVGYSEDGGASWIEGARVGFGQLWAIDFGPPGSAAFVAGLGGLIARRAPH